MAISVDLQGDLLVYSVADTRIGIGKDALETVFADTELNRKIVCDLLCRTSYPLIETPDGETGVQDGPGRALNRSRLVPRSLPARPLP